MTIAPTEKIWFNGNLVPWDEARIHVLTHSLHYGLGVLEGIRSHETADGPALFRLTDHMERLHQSARMMMMPLPFGIDDLVQAAKDVVRANGIDDCYVRPIAYYGYGEMGLNTLPCSVDVAIACWRWDSYLGDAATTGARLKISSWQRPGHNTLPPAAKTTANYVNSSLAKVEALKAGYDEAVILNTAGFVAECSAENLFCVRSGVLTMPPPTAGALHGLTQDSVAAIARDLGFETREGNVTRSDLYSADEVLVCGTAAGVSAVASVDDHSLTCPGPMTTALAYEYSRAAHGLVDRYKNWVEHVG